MRNLLYLAPLLTSCFGNDFCMADVQGEWVVDSFTVGYDDCQIEEIQNNLMSKTYHFTGSEQNAVSGDIDCRFQGDNFLYCDGPLFEVYKHLWQDDIINLSFDNNCESGQYNWSGYSDGLVLNPSEMIVNVGFSADCLRDSSEQGAPLDTGYNESSRYCNSDMQLKLKRTIQ
jgi:hypothetical protein